MIDAIAVMYGFLKLKMLEMKSALIFTRFQDLILMNLKGFQLSLIASKNVCNIVTAIMM